MNSNFKNFHWNSSNSTSVYRRKAVREKQRRYEGEVNIEEGTMDQRGKYNRRRRTIEEERRIELNKDGRKNEGEEEMRNGSWRDGPKGEIKKTCVKKER